MHISKVYIKNIRSIDKLSIDFTSKSKSLILSGDNGSGKSTILRCIAMGISDENSAASVLRELSGDFVKSGEDQGEIVVHLNLGYKKYKIWTFIESLKAFEKIKQTVYKFEKGSYKIIKNQEDFPWDKIFAAGYGAGVRNLGTADYQHYVAIDALYPLFKYDAPLQNPELAMRRIIEKARKKGKREKDGGLQEAKSMEKYLTDLLKGILNLDRHGKVILTSTSIQIKNRKWGKHELGTLGDGYVSTTTWILDLISWWMLYLKLNGKNIINIKNINGLVLVDEVEQHLHPIWQIKIMRLLNHAFPKIQFVLSTHSPLVISGSQDIPVLILRESGHEIRSVSGWLSEDVYRDIMGLPSSRNDQFKIDLDKYEKLHWKKLDGKASAFDLKELKRLNKQLLSTLPGDDPIVITSKLENMSKLLNED